MCVYIYICIYVYIYIHMDIHLSSISIHFLVLILEQSQRYILLKHYQRTLSTVSAPPDIIYNCTCVSIYLCSSSYYLEVYVSVVSRGRTVCLLLTMNKGNSIWSPTQSINQSLLSNLKIATTSEGQEGGFSKKILNKH